MERAHEKEQKAAEDVGPTTLGLFEKEHATFEVGRYLIKGQISFKLVSKLVSYSVRVSLL